MLRNSARLIGEATEQAAHHTGPGVGGFLNATFGNAPELIIALFAVNEAKFEVVRGSLTGSVVGNLLLVLGFSLLFGGRGELGAAGGQTEQAPALAAAAGDGAPIGVAALATEATGNGSGAASNGAGEDAS